MKALVLVFAVTVQCVLSVEFRVDPLVLIEQGLVRGQKSTDGDYSYFLGIPYAKIDSDNPFGEFLPPTSFEEEIFEANDGTTVCPQIELHTGKARGDLNCLVLHIYSPNEATSRNPFPVYVHIHGGGFTIGSANAEGISNLVKHGIVVVSINYRLGPYGFMCLDNPGVPGNQGLKDQYEALKWVKKNIGAFGGNPYNITIGGQSAGSMSVLYHLFSHREKNFYKIIAESGSEQTVGLMVDGDQEAPVKLAIQLGFNTSDAESALEFLARTSSDLVIGASAAIDLQFLPCKERAFEDVDSFITDYQVFLSNERNIKNTPILIGNTDAEFKINGLLSDKYTEKDVFRKYLEDPYYFGLQGDQLEEATNMLKHFYIGDDSVSDNVANELSEFVSDFLFNHPIQRSINKLLSNGAGSIYMYLFSDGENGADHCAELKYLFHNQTDNEKLSEEEELLQSRISTLWANFVKYGNPTPEVTDLLPLTWTPLSSDKRPYLRIDKELKLEHRPLKERMAFWDIFYVAYGVRNNVGRKKYI